MPRRLCFLAALILTTGCQQQDGGKDPPRAEEPRKPEPVTKASAKPKVDDKNAVELRRLEEERLARRAEQERIKREAAERERLAKQREADQKRQAEEDLAKEEQRVNELWQKHRHNFFKADGRIWRASDATGTSLEGTLRITQVVDAWNTIVQAEEFGYVKQTWWITEIPTGKLVDDAKFRMNNGDFAFIGTKRYPSLLGTRTVRLAVPVAVTNSGIGLDDFHTVVAQGIPLGPAKQTAKEAQRAAEERERQRLADERADAKLREAARQARLEAEAREEARKQTPEYKEQEAARIRRDKEEEASRKLQLALTLLRDGEAKIKANKTSEGRKLIEFGLRRLEAIVQDCPMTPAAAEAKKLLAKHGR